MPEIMIAVRPGVVYMPGLGRRMVRKGRTTAHATHPIVTEHPKLWAPMAVDYPAPEMEPQDLTETADAAARRLAAELDRLDAGLAELGIPLDESVGVDEAPVTTALAALKHRTEQLEVTSMSDKDPVFIPAGPAESPADDPPDVDRKAVRAWAAEQGIEVPARGKIRQAVVDQYLAAQGG